MKESRILHDKAMDSLSEAYELRKRAEEERANEKFAVAFQQERDAALMEQGGPEPTRSVLFSSAATIAYNYRNLAQAEKMIAFGLCGDPPEDIANELRDLLEKVNFNRHLLLRGVELQENEMQLSLSGPEAGCGVIKAEEFLSRFDAIRKMAYRIAERKRNLPFRKHGQVSRELRQQMEPWLSVPRAASYAVTIRFGRNIENDLFDDVSAKNVISEILYGMNVVQEKKLDMLKERIAKDDYFINMLALVKELAPDNENINFVGITANIDRKIETSMLTEVRKNIRIPILAPKDDNKVDEPVEIIGKDRKSVV